MSRLQPQNLCKRWAVGINIWPSCHRRVWYSQGGRMCGIHLIRLGHPWEAGESDLDGHSAGMNVTTATSYASSNIHWPGSCIVLRWLLRPFRPPGVWRCQRPGLRCARSHLCFCCCLSVWMGPRGVDILFGKKQH